MSDAAEKMPDGPESLQDQLKLLRKSGQIHGSWYKKTYPDVEASGLTPAEHYLRFGALMGRNPRAGFDTSYYLQTYPDVAESGLNPLVHYILHGEGEGRRTRPESGQAEGRMPDAVRQVRQKLLSLGLTFRAQSELGRLAEKGETPRIRAAAAHELALWAMRAKTAKSYGTALEQIARVRENDPDLERRSRLVTLELLCHLHLGQPEAAQEAFYRAAGEGLVTPDVLLAWSNFLDDPEDRLARMNMALRHYGIAPLALLPDESLPPYDRLTLAAPLPLVTEGPLVTVLIAAYEAADTIGTALRALQEQTWQNLEILVLDDCSPDDTCAVVEGFAARDPRIRLVRMAQNGGAYVARNEGLDLARGDFVTLHDADDWAHPLRIETQVKYLQDNPGVLGCTTQQARADSSLGFTRWTGEGHFIIPNVSSFLFRRAEMREHFGYWDTARFSADSELIRRMRKKFGSRAVQELSTGPFAFQRDSGSSIIADEALGINGFLFGARKEYLDAQSHFHKSAEDLRYGKDPARRPFPVPAIMHADRPRLPSEPRFDVILTSDFGMDDDGIEACIQEIQAARAAGCRVGLFEMYRYDLPRQRLSMNPTMRRLIDGESVRILTFGQTASCDLMLVCYPPVLHDRQRYVPQIKAGMVKVLLNHLPRKDGGPQRTGDYTLERCANNIRHYFGQDALWYPVSPPVREALLTDHAKDLPQIALSPEDWPGIDHLSDWQRGPDASHDKHLSASVDHGSTTESNPSAAISPRR